MSTPPPVLMSTDDVRRARPRAGYWADWIERLFHGLQSDLYGDVEMDGRMPSAARRRRRPDPARGEPAPRHALSAAPLAPTTSAT